MADYAAQANSIYDPQLQADTAAATAEHAAGLGAFTTEQNTAQNAYTDALKTASTARDLNYAKNDQVAQTHGLFSSGLSANMQRLTGANYADNASKIGELRAQKLADIAGRQTGYETNYQAKLGALTSKYQGEKANYIATNQNADAKAQAAAQAAMARAQFTANSRAPKAITGYGMTRNADAASGLAFHGPNGQPISIGKYYAAISDGQAGGKDIAQALASSGSKNDHTIAKDINDNNLTDAQIQTKYPWLYQ